MLLDHYRSELVEIESKEKTLASLKKRVLQKLSEYAFLDDSNQIEQKLRDLCSTGYLVQSGIGKCYFIHIVGKIIFENGRASFPAHEFKFENVSPLLRDMGETGEVLSREIYDPSSDYSWKSITKEEYTYLLSEAQEVVNKMKMFSKHFK